MSDDIWSPGNIPCPVLDWKTMLSIARPGDAMYFWNTQPVSKVIEGFTGGPSHVIQLAKFAEDPTQFYHFEAVFPEGVRLMPLSHYATDNCPRVLVRRKGATPADVNAATGEALRVIGRKYEVPEEIQMALHKVAPWMVHIERTENELFCSGLLQNDFATTSVPYAVPSQGNPSPMFLLQDLGNDFICKVSA